MDASEVPHETGTELGVKDPCDELPNRSLVSIIRIDPATVDLGFAHRLGHVLPDALHEFLAGICISRTGRPRSQQRLVKEVFIVADRCVQTLHLSTVPPVPSRPAAE